MANQVQTIHLDHVINHHSQDMTGKVVAITGTTSGTGFICAREVAKKGATVILLNRQSERSIKAYQMLKDSVPDGKFDATACDLQSFESVIEAIAAIKSKYDIIDVLVNNAGVMALKDEATKDGYDVQIQTNCLSHFLITKELFPLIQKSSEARVINHSSMARIGGPLEPQYFEKRGGALGGDGTEEENKSFRGPRWARYHQTKLANCAFTYGLKKKLEAANISNILPLLAHPGLALTNLQVTTAVDGGMDANSEFMAIAQTAEDGATGIIRAAMDPDAKSGDFFGPSGKGWAGYPELLTPEEHLYSNTNIQINWEGCEKAVGNFML
ncbi:MAG: NAD(P)-dependent dehydrogenase (short-subunit alcohol dehydrogenase family) [Cyclobacteriaceae bacterium]|jgi:NAD(P)-dependent dehydrogenase (short-subunit alcohol dehydrogenase family)